MEESEIDEYTLNFSDKQLSLRISLINNNKISLIIKDEMGKEKYTSIFSLTQIKRACKNFSLIETIKETLDLLKQTLELGQIILSQDSKGALIQIKFNINFYTFIKLISLFNIIN